MATNTGQTQIRQNINARSQYVFTGGKIISATKENHSPNGQQPAPPVGFAKNLFDKTLFIFERNFAHSLEKLCSSVGRNFAIRWKNSVHSLEKPFPAHLLPVLMAMFPSRCRHKRFAGVQGMSDKRRTPVNRKLCGRGASAIMHRETGQMMAFALRRARAETINSGAAAWFHDFKTSETGHKRHETGA